MQKKRKKVVNWMNESIFFPLSTLIVSKDPDKVSLSKYRVKLRKLGKKCPAEIP